VATNINDKGGAMNALANYWLTRFIYEADCEKRAVPEYNLSDGGASEPFADWLVSKGIKREAAGTASAGFEAGLWFASALERNFVDCDPELRTALDDCLESLDAHREDAHEGSKEPAQAVNPRREVATDENPAEEADLLTTVNHKVAAITDRKGKLTAVRLAVDEVDDCADRIELATQSGEPPARADLDRLIHAVTRLDDAIGEAPDYYNRAATAAELLTGALLRETNGDLAERNSASEHAKSEAIV